MPKCPNCNYELTLLEYKRVYKCSKCRKVFPQRKFDFNEFLEGNKRKREEEWKKIYNKKISKEEYRKRNKEACKKWYLKNREKLLAKDKIRNP